MRHLFSSLVRVTEQSTTYSKGSLTSGGWVQVNEMFDVNFGKPGLMKCRLDLQFIRPGKDAPRAQESAVVNDRQGLMYCSITPYLKAGQRLECVAGPIIGSFDIMVVPEDILDYRGAHHMEVNVVESKLTRERGNKVLDGLSGVQRRLP